ncbi:MAG: NAD(P)/FAD-dependent oxidoreductase [Candidatus Promineifilaceae bacterium]
MHRKSADPHHFIIIGAGPAGLTAAHELTRQGYSTTVFEKQDKVGGIARTENYKGYYFDMGGHRFYTRSAEIQQFWQDILGDDLLRRPRLSRIYFNNKFFYYPLRPLNAMWNLGPLEAVRIMLSYSRWHLFPYREEETFEQWVTNRFGKRLFQTFFKAYTEKVWGIPCSELKAEWAAQRIKNLSLRNALSSMFVKPNGRITSLIEAFYYPRRGPGMMWQAVGERVEQQGGQLHLDSQVIRIRRAGNRITEVEVCQNGRPHTISGTDFISSMPIAQFLKRLDPPPPSAVLAAANSLRYRDFLTVCLIINRPHLFPDNWIYVHEPGVKVGRIQNFKNWSADMVPDPNTTSLGLEYFCNDDDPLWQMSDDMLIELGKREIEQIGLAKSADVTDGCVFRVPKSYPIYDSAYQRHLDTIRSYLSSFENFQTIGRNGLHRYNNQDHAMLTGLLAVKNSLHNQKHNLWKVNAEENYLEETTPAPTNPKINWAPTKQPA